MNDTWWKNAVVYQIYPRSFRDSNADGIGDLRGILQQLDYIRTLGADVIWLCPIYASPNADNGYDISDYRAIHPDFGTMHDFDCLLSQIHARGMKLVMDLVVNHTSDEHAWFQQARLSRTNPYHDYYIWRDNTGNVPNNWNSWFGGSSWEYNPPTDEYYLHIFAKKQPDLNWRNPRLRREIYDMMCWWLNKGVDGFRMDVISLISKPDELPDAPFGDLSAFCINGPYVHEYLQEMHEQVLSRYDIMTVGECPGITVDEAKKYAGEGRRELNMVFSFEHTSLTDGPYGKWTNARTPLPALKKTLAKWQDGLRGTAWNCLFWGNHDQPRAVSKFGCDMPEHRDRAAKMLCACLYLMQGTAYVYQGEELGMANPGFFSLDQYRDIETINAYHNLVDSGTLDPRTMLEYLACTSRDNARTPMQWTAGACAGFTSGDPWISPGRNFRAVNAEREVADEQSVYHFYRRLLAFRKQSPIVQNGTFLLLWPEHMQIFAYRRQYRGQTLLIFCNFTKDDAALPEPAAMAGKILFSNYDSPHTAGILRAFEVIVTLSDESEVTKQS